jgi:glucose-1-phosphate adenylyltransferase
MKIQGVNIQEMRSTGGILSKALTFILAGGEGRRLNPLTRNRPKPLIPFGGSFRIVDFTLSNCLHSGLQRTYVLTQHENETIHCYLRRWSPGERLSDFIVANPPASGKRYRGTADAIFQNLPPMQSGDYEFVLILSAGHVYTMDYRELVRFHVARAAEVTIAGVHCPLTPPADTQLLAVDEEERVIGIERRRQPTEIRPTYSPTMLANMNVYVVNRETILKAAYTGSHRPLDFDHDVIPNLIGTQRVYAYRHADRLKRPLYWRDLCTLDGYYGSNMDLLARAPLFDPYDPQWPVRSAESPATAAETNPVDRVRASTSNSIVAQGTDATCASVQHSIVCSGVVLENGVVVRDSILMPGVTIGHGSSVRGAIIDSNVRIAAGDRIGFEEEHDRSRFPVTSGGVVIVSPIEKTVAPLHPLRPALDWPYKSRP